MCVGPSGHCSCPGTSWRDLWVRFSLWFMGQVPAQVKKSVNRICAPLVPSNILICFFPDLPSPNHRALNLILWVSVGEKRVSLAASAQVGSRGSLTTLPFSRQEDSGLLCSKFCHLEGRSNAGKVPLTHANASRLIIFFFNCSNGVLDFYKVSVLCVHLHGWCFPSAPIGY